LEGLDDVVELRAHLHLGAGQGRGVDGRVDQALDLSVDGRQDLVGRMLWSWKR